MTKPPAEGARWTLCVSYLDVDGSLVDDYVEEYPTRKQVESRIITILRDGLFRDVSYESRLEEERERRSLQNDDSPLHSGPTFSWWPPHRIVQCYYFRLSSQEES